MSSKNIYKKEIKLNSKEYKIKQTIPLNYTIENDVLYKIDIIDKKEIKTILSPIPVFIKSILENVDTLEQKVELLYYRIPLEKWQTIIIDKNIICDTRLIITLANKGIPVNSSNAKRFVDYFYWLEQENLFNIPILKTTNTMGWHLENSCFVPFTDKVLLDIDSGVKNWEDAFSSCGCLDNWVQEMSCFRSNDIFRFILSSSFAAPLISILKHRIFIIYNYGNSRAGKTSALHAALSIWGNPNELKMSFNTTSVGIERVSNFFKDFPLALDEKQVNKSQSNIEQLIYMLGNGVGRIRGAKTGGIQQINSWSNIVLATGEEPLADENTTTGVSTRCLEIEGSPYDYDEEAASRMYGITNNNYGIAGRKFINLILEKYSNNNFKILKERFEKIKSKLKNLTENNISSYISSVALITLADTIISEELFNESNNEKSYIMAKNILNNLNKEKDIDIIEKAYEQVSSWIIANTGNFGKIYYKNGYANNTKEFLSNQTNFGLYEEENNNYFVHINVLKDYLISHKYNYTKTVKEFAKRGYIIPSYNDDGTIKATTIQKKYLNINHRMFWFCFAKADENEENENIINNSEIDLNILKK